MSDGEGFDNADDVLAEARRARDDGISGDHRRFRNSRRLDDSDRRESGRDAEAR